MTVDPCARCGDPSEPNCWTADVLPLCSTCWKIDRGLLAPRSKRPAVAPVVVDLDALPDLDVRVRLHTLESAQAQCQRDLAALMPRLMLSGWADRLEARREERRIVAAYAALARELRALGVT